MPTKAKLIQAFQDCDLDCSSWDKSVLEELAIVALESIRDPTDEELLAPGKPYRVQKAIEVPESEGIQRRREAWNTILNFMMKE